MSAHDHRSADIAESQDPDEHETEAGQAEDTPIASSRRRPDARVEDTTAQQFLRAGRLAWAGLGIAAALVVAGLVLGRLTLVVVPLILALFPAALLQPVASWLKRKRVPPAVASLACILGSLLLFSAVVAIFVPIVADQLPDLAESFGDGVSDLEGFLTDAPLPIEIGNVQDLLDRARDQIGDAGQLAGGAVDAVTTAAEGVAAILFGVVALFFYLKDGERIAAGVRDTLPLRMRRHAAEMGGRAWFTLGRYFRGQLFIALVDALFIGLGLVLLGIPLAIPLAFLVFLGGLFPIVGAFVSGTLAVLVALADAGIGTALIVLALIVVVQQVESNVLEPVVLSRAISLHPLAVITALTIGGVTIGILGAFLAVPVAAAAARALDYLRGRSDLDEEDPSDDAESSQDG